MTEYKAGLIGKTLVHSLSPQIQKYITGEEYGLFEIEEDKIESFVKSTSLLGFNVTVPYKKAVIPFLTALSAEARRTGAVNTVTIKNGVLTGYNTDVYGFRQLLLHTNTNPENKTVLILGSGGAAAAVKTALTDLNAKKIITVSRSGSINYQNVYGIKNPDIIINATPVGMFPGEAEKPLELSLFDSVDTVLDLIYNPFNTKLTLEAAKLGMKTENGLYMLICQAIKSCELFYGTSCQKNLADKIYKQISSDFKNILLVGMPGCGKTETGKALAKKLNKPFFDTDDEIFKKYGKTPEEIILSDGENVFRRLESEIAVQVGNLHGAVISTGGGIVTEQNNIFNLKKNSDVFFIDRDIAALSPQNRPLTQKCGITELYSKRLPLYLFCADFTVKAKSSPDETADEIIKILK